jgi:hypothetical protein
MKPYTLLYVMAAIYSALALLPPHVFPALDIALAFMGALAFVTAACFQLNTK